MQIILGCMDLDHTLRIEKPPSPTDSAFEQRKLHKKWDHSNRMSLMIIKRDILEVFRGIVSDDVTSAKEFLLKLKSALQKAIRRKQVSSSKLNFHEVSRQRKCQGIHYGNVKYCFKIKGTKAWAIRRLAYLFSANFSTFTIQLV